MASSVSKKNTDKSSDSISKRTFFAALAAAIIVSFAAGTRGNEILGAVAPIFGIKIETGSLDLASVQQTYQELKANYDGDLDSNALIEGASKGLVEAADDPYTAYLDAEEAKEFEDSLTGNIGGGIGAEIGLRNDQPTVVRLLPGNPAEKSGLMEGDVIVGVNGEAVGEWTLDETVRHIRGEVGTSVKLSVLREGKPHEYSVTRAIVDNPSVRSEIKDGIGILTISRFDNETASLARKVAQNFKEQNVKGVILDLRDNGGGYLTAAQDVAGIWLDKKVVVSERTGGKEVDTLMSSSDPLLNGVETIVLVNASTASASEIVAGALKDHGAAKLLGEKTFGKGTVQKVIALNGGAQLKVTVARWYTPNGNNISKEGIAVDTKVKMTIDDVNEGKDPQMKAALGLFK